MRVAHWLKTNARIELPQHLIFVDTETKEAYHEGNTSYHKLWFGWACHVRLREETAHLEPRETWFRFETNTAFWEWVETLVLPKTRLWILAHNWNFDAGILSVSEFLGAPRWRLVKYINDKPPFILSFRNDNSTILLIDTLNYFLGSLESIGDAIGVPKLEMPALGAGADAWDEYCKRDVRVMQRAFLGFRDLVASESLGNFQTTLASQAFAAYRHRYMHHKILIHDNEYVSQSEREAYYGGRSECFRLGHIQEKLYYLDVNSLYPTVMSHVEYPIKLERQMYRPTVAQLAKVLETHAVVARVTIEAKEPCYPVRHDGRLVFPVGHIEGFYCSPEIQYAIDHDELIDVRWVSVYERADIFTEYMKELYALRQRYPKDVNPTFNYCIKTLMNSLYGKFGQNGNKWEEVKDEFEWFIGTLLYYDERTDTVRKLRRRLGLVQEFKRRGESQNSFPAIAGHVTSYGRAHMRNLFQRVGWENVYYTDTDSLITNQTGYDILKDEIDASLLGKLSLEHTSEDMTIWGPKDYRFGDVVRHKGVRRNARRVRVRTWEQEQFVSWDYLASQGLDGFIPIKTITKTLHRIYKKGNVDKNGIVTPLRFSKGDT